MGIIFAANIKVWRQRGKAWNLITDLFLMSLGHMTSSDLPFGRNDKKVAYMK